MGKGKEVVWSAASSITLTPPPPVFSLFAATSAHSLRHFYTAVWEPGQGVPQFIAMGYVDGQPIDRYDSDSRKKVPSVPWMNRVEEHDPEYWQWNTQRTWNAEQRFRGDLVTLRKHHNESGGEWGAEMPGPLARPPPHSARS